MSSLRTDSTAAVVAHCVAIVLMFACAVSRAAAVHPRVFAEASAKGEADALLVFADQSRPLMTPLAMHADSHVRRRALVAALQARAERDQVPLRAWLDAHGIMHRDFWIANLIQARVPAALLSELAARRDLWRVEPNPQIAPKLPTADIQPEYSAPLATATIEWGVSKIEAPSVWAAGFTGQGVVIGGEDTGYQWDHPALKPHYRGWNGTSADHDFNWHDAIHDAIGNTACNNDSLFPCDDNGHGTHTAGTFAGNDGAGNQVGVAPGAKWIGCRNMDRGTGTPARYIECMQWMIAPTDLSGSNANPDLGADVISNSWSCPSAEGCTVGDELQAAVDNVVAAGIFYAVAAQNSGSACMTILDPPAIYDASFVVGATNSSEALANFSSRGPVSGSGLIRPDLSAPGVNVRSSYPPNTYTSLNGTSMATPHVAGAAALLMSAFPALKGHPDKIGAILRGTAVQDVTDPVLQSCGGTPITTWPNYMVGYGRLDVFDAYNDVIFIDGFDG